IKETCRDIYSLYLEIDQYDSAINYRINLDQGTPIQIFDGYIDSTLIILPDINFNLSSYCIDIEAFDPCNGSSSTSTQVCSVPSSLSLSPFESLYSSYEGSNIFVNLDQVSSGTFEVSRRFEGGEFQSRGSYTGSFTDEIGSITRKYFYQIDYRDSCNTILYSAETHPPHIDTDLLSENQYQVVLTNADNSLTTLTESVYEVGNTGTISSETVTSTQFDLRLNAKDGAPRQFLNIISNYNGTLVRSNSQILKYELIVHVPSAFTPNGDGLNDVLEFFGLPSESASISIYSRWGQLLFNTEDPNEGWDGMIGGTTAPEGTYLYEIIFETTEGQKLRQKGTFALINK
ncbi:MAG: gliding motility-associated C-terminal domain-containing protein, partial [Bacteroidota bacterium]